MTALHYLAYGSNLHPLRLVERVPSARVINVVELPARHVNFHKRSVDGSGKCNLTHDENATSYGVLYAFSSVERAALNRLEGFGKGYKEALLQFTVAGVQYNPYVYIAEASYIDPSLRPYDWYKEMVLLGACYHRLPSQYIATIEQVPSIVDPNPTRVAEKKLLLDQMRML